MAKPAEKIAASVAVLRRLQRDGRRVVRSEQLSRTHRERLVGHGVLQPIIKGWLMPGGLAAVPAEAARVLWEFCGAYSTARFRTDWHLSPEDSLLRAVDPERLPGRVVVYALHGTNNTLALPFDTTLYDLRCGSMPAGNELSGGGALRELTTEAALVRVAESFFVRHREAAHAALARIGTAEILVTLLAEGGHSVAAGRLAGAFRRVDRVDVADEILRIMKAAGYDVRVVDPFERASSTPKRVAQVTPMVARMQALWQAMRETVVRSFPAPPEPRPDGVAYVRSLDDVFGRDAFHSLALEGYRVTPELIHRAETADADPEGVDDAPWARELLAARAYWRAFQLVKRTVAKVVAGENAGALTRAAYVQWQRELSAASDGVRAGTTSDAGSRHMSLRWKVEREAVPALFELLEREPEAAVRAVLGHWMFGSIHQYPASDGRLARFVLNVMLASGGYPWMVIRVDDRGAYLAALESASLNADIQPLARFIADRVGGLLEPPGTPRTVPAPN